MTTLLTFSSSGLGDQSYKLLSHLGTALSRTKPVTLDITLVRGTKSVDLRDESLLGIGLCKSQNGFAYFGDITPDSQADRAGIISGDVPLVNGRPIEYIFFSHGCKKTIGF